MCKQRAQTNTCMHEWASGTVNLEGSGHKVISRGKMAAAPLSLGTKIREELTCSICLELFTRPKVLPCQHTFCQDCLEGLARKGRNIQCPNCRQKVRLRHQGVAGLPDSIMAASMLESLQNQATLSGEIKEQPLSGNRCGFHPSEEVKLYCKQCNMPVCTECCEEGHDGHPTTSLANPVQTLINEGRNILESYLSFLRSLREEEKTLDGQKQQRDSSIIQTYIQMVQKLTEQKDHLLSESQQNHSENLDRIQTDRDKVLADVSELSAACDRAEQELQQGWVEYFSPQTTLTEVVGKYRGKAAPTPVQAQPAVFHPTDSPVPVLGHVTSPIPTISDSAASNNAASGTGHNHGNQRRRQKRVTFGGWGSKTGEFYCPHGVTVSDEGEIFVADSDNYRIQVFTLQGTFVRQFPTVVPGEDVKVKPNDVALDGEGHLWMVGKTYMNDAEIAVQYIKPDRVLRTFDLQRAEWDRGVAVNTRRNHILITQTDGNCGEVLVFRPDGTLVRTVGQQQGMKRPWYITVDGEGNILVSDYANHCIYVYNEDGQFVFQLGGEGSGKKKGKLNDPRGICTDRAGNIFVADTGNKRVEMFDKTGRFLKHVTSGMGHTCAVAMAPQGQLVVTTDWADSVYIFPNY
ncbi:tripartite motif-containing protein 3-like [Branchiostoma lanceolatum]|uniref:tripartite motif-containing protein 3-like n=1 Tax=Branchiostoma lanceolatum TaxID=7740 RepID=UPI0034536CBD